MSSSLQFIYAELARSMLGGHPGTSQPAPPPGLDGFAARRVRTPRGFTMTAGRRCATALESTRSGLAGRCPPRPDLQKGVGGWLLKIHRALPIFKKGYMKINLLPLEAHLQKGCPREFLKIATHS